MDKGPSQWHMLLPKGLAEEEAAAAAAAAADSAPNERHHRWSNVGMTAAATDVQIEGVSVNLKELLSPRTIAAAAAPPLSSTPAAVAAASAPDAAAAEGEEAGDSSATAETATAGAAAAPAAAETTTPATAAAAAAADKASTSCGRWCQVESQQRGCCVVSFNTMCYLLQQLQQAKPDALETAIISPTLPVSNKKGDDIYRAVLIQAEPIVLQSTLPLPQQAEVYCEVELLSYTPFKSYIAIGVAAAPYPPHHLPGLLPGSCALLSTGQVFKGNCVSVADADVLMDELKLFYSCFNPPMVPKAKGMVVLNISRQKEFNEELKEAYGKDLTDVAQYALNKRKLTNFFRQHDIRRLSQVDRIFEDFDGDPSVNLATVVETQRVPEKNLWQRYVKLLRVEAMLIEYFDVVKKRQDLLKIGAVAEQALLRPATVDSFLRDRYKKGINVLLKGLELWMGIEMIDLEGFLRPSLSKHFYVLQR
ncbi:hypothetical protein, conserved [Eimeria praecox]|uniref:Uncharacterized protein n=1 Tax=Eimeria praecox TaxID=51316 RepID=U6GYS6_9EIME|nr:hypothetical protein, conserved [Eimeria praecox]